MNFSTRIIMTEKLEQEVNVGSGGGRRVIVRCLFDNHVLSVPSAVVGSDGDAAEEYRERELSGSRIFVSGEGAFYCTRKCWSNYCD